MTDAVLLSIIIPVYNVESYLPRCAESVFSQMTNECEVIFVDDGSTDDSGRICDNYASSTANVSVVHKKNGGLSSARNVGMKSASGQYLLFVDSDDYLLWNAIDDLLSIIVSYAPDIIKFDYTRILGDEGTDVSSPLKDGLYSSESELKDLLHRSLRDEHSMILSAWSHVYNSRFIESNNLLFVSEREIGSEDYLFNLQAYLYASSIYHINRCLYAYVARDGSLTEIYRPKLYKQYTDLYKRIMSSFQRKDEYGLFSNDILHFYIWLVYAPVLQQELAIGGKENIRRVRRVLRSHDFHDALEQYDSSTLSLKQKFLCSVMKHRLWIVLYVIYLVKR